MQRSLAERVASVQATDVKGRYYRHAAVGRDAFAGGRGGRWGSEFPVIYLGRPPESVIAEAYRHLVEEGGIDPQMVKPRSFYEVDVAIEEVVDLTDRNNLERVGLTLDDVMSAVDDYDACQDVAAVAHQLGRHGILAPAATRLGTTLAIFRERVSIAELPVPVEETTWTHLPPDPRELRLVEKSSRQSSPAPPS